MNYWQLHIGDWAKSCGHLSPSETGFYIRLMNVYYDTESPLSAEVNTVYRLMGARTPREREEIAGLLAEFFDLQEDGYHNKRADIEISKLHEKSDKARRSAALRWDSERNANASRTHSEGNALQDSKTPRLQDSKKKQKQVAPMALPDWLPADAWQAFVDHRKAIRKPMSAKAMSLSLMTIEKLVINGQDPVAVINKSIENGWTGLFAIKPEGMHHGTIQPTRLSAVERALADNEQHRRRREGQAGRTIDG